MLSKSIKNNFEQFYSNGKLLISGEYVVLNGAVAFALPAKFGQEMHVTKNSSPHINWETTNQNKKWFNAVFDNNNFDILNTNINENALYLQKLLKVCKRLAPDFFNNGYNIKCNLGFDKDWGLGSSSSLIANLAKWINRNPYKLNNLISSGSGYDIACANANSPILYQLKNKKPQIEPINFYPEYNKNMLFIYSRKKQKTDKEILKYKNKLNKIPNGIIEDISYISKRMSLCKNIDEFIYLINNHEQIISKLINRNCLKKDKFADFNGEVKSLGAWGGDFFMAVSKKDQEYIRKYFFNKNYQTIFDFDELIYTKH